MYMIMWQPKRSINEVVEESPLPENLNYPESHAIRIGNIHI